MYPFNIREVDGGNESEQGKRGIDINTVIAYKNPFVVNVIPVTVSLALGEGVAYSAIFSCPLLQKIKASIMTNVNSLVSGILGYDFRLYMMVPQRSKEAQKTSEGLPVSLPVTFQEKQYNTKDKGSRNSTVELKKTVIHQSHIPCQN